MPHGPEPGAGPDVLTRARERRAQGRADEALAELRAALAARPDFAEAQHQLGNLLKSLGRFSEAIIALREAVRLAPGEAALWLNLGVACLEGGEREEAVAAFRRAIALEPARPEAHNILGHALLVQGRCEEAAASLATALRLRPGYPAAHDNLGRVLKAQGRAAEAVAHHRAALAGEPRPTTHSNLLYSLNFVAGLSPGEIFSEHCAWAERQAGQKQGVRLKKLTCPIAARPRRDRTGQFFQPDPLLLTRGPAEGRQLRIGYVSPDLVHHAVAYFFEPVLAAHDRTRFETFCYSDAPVPDAVTLRLRAQAGQWRETSRLSDAQLAALIREDRIDILVDLAGHTARHRLLVFALRPAPVQVTWLGYPNTTGLAAIDYRLTDAVSDPPGRTEAWHSETLVRLPETFSCYRPPDDSPPVRPRRAAEAIRPESGGPPAGGAVPFTFGCFNNLAKVTPPMIELWAEVLREHPGAHLFLKSRGLADPATAARVRGDFVRAGVAAERIELNGEELSVSRHLSLYDRVDVALDTAPYNGTTTTCEALWMGVPVVTLAGRTHVARVGASLLTHLGAPEWIATSPAEYRACCRNLANDPLLLASLRRNLRERMARSPLCDARRFVGHLEDAFRSMWAAAGEKEEVISADNEINGGSALEKSGKYYLKCFVSVDYRVCAPDGPRPATESA